MIKFRHHTARGQTLVGILVVLVILLALAAVLFFRARGPGKGAAATTPKAAMQKAEATACMAQLSNLRQGLMIYQADHNGYPPNLQALDLGPGESYYRCPVTGQAYQYNPQTGEVTCPAGHGATSAGQGAAAGGGARGLTELMKQR